jgi:3D (Asp-Asp-Asp) domain-containing protein
MKKKLIIAALLPMLVLPFSGELSYNQPVTKQVAVQQDIHNPPEVKQVETELEIEYDDYMIFEATVYTRSAEEETLDGITASGTIVSRGTVSVDPRIIPLGTKLYVEGYGHAYALDTGGAIKGNRIDLYVETKKEAFEWGRRQVKVWILK